MTEKMKLEDYITPKLIFVNENFESSDDMFATIYEKSLDLGYVHNTFLEKIIEREKNFPTGLQLEKMGVAIPHTDAECIKKEFVAIVTTHPVTFVSMEDFNQSVAAEIVFVLGLKEPHAQLEMLQSLMGLLQNSEILAQIRKARSAEAIVTIVKTNNI
ncbi:PTS sugar transporter subunit IIA [Streptococcus orisasini]|uniref:PTS sugar transporter subunit IIA n=1 Tax=Streptococcus orisasini TaxID=1080071 RepID=UPI000709FEE2|nr:PTS sugar transporter subunit IIA [Streptococcus orisasini]